MFVLLYYIEDIFLMKNVLITGGSGFAGKSLSFFLSKKKLNIWSTYNKNKISKKQYIKLNLLNTINLNLNFDCIIHTAFHHKIDDFKVKPKKKYFNNIKMIKNLIFFSKKNKIKNFIFYSSFDLNYPKKNTKKIFYIRSKIKSEKLLLNALKKKIFKRIFILRIPAIIGKDANSTFISETQKKLKKNKNIDLWDYNKKFNKLVNINDLNNLVYNLLKNKFKNKHYLIDCLSSGSEKLIDLINYMKIRTKSKSKIILHKNKKMENKPLLNKKINYKFYKARKAILI